MSYSKEDLKYQLQKMGLKETDSVMVHSSMKAMGNVEGGAETVLDAFIEYFSKGLFMVPTHTWKQMGAEHSLFDPSTEPSCVGVLTNLILKREGAFRSLHPTHSIAAIGEGAEEYVKGEENLSTPCAPGGCWDRLRSVHGKILLIGVTHARNTFIHSVEEVYDVPERFTAEPAEFQIKMPDGSIKDVKMYRHYNPYQAHISEDFDKMSEGYFVTGAAEKVKLGDAECILCDAEKIFEVTGRILSKEINCFIERAEIPSEWYMEEV